MRKMYVEPAAYITPSMRKILEEGDSKTLKQKQKNISPKKKSKSIKTTIDDGWIRRIAKDTKE